MVNDALPVNIPMDSVTAVNEYDGNGMALNQRFALLLLLAGFACGCVLV